MKELTVDVVAADRQVWTGQAVSVTVRTTEGELGLLANHTPVLAALIPGTVRIATAAGDELTATLEGDGFVSMENNRVAVVASSLEMGTGASSSRAS